MLTTCAHCRTDSRNQPDSASAAAGTDFRDIKVEIEPHQITVHAGGQAFPISPDALPAFSCRSVAQEALAWATKRIGEELEKSVAFYRTGQATDKVILADGDSDD